MHGPDIQWYVVLSALLFATGALGVMLRRSPLIILLSVEIMLNSANLLLIAFSRLHGREDGQVFAISVMAVAASEVVVGLGLIVAHGAAQRRARRRQAEDAARVNAAAWTCLLLPLASAVAITLGGTRISRRLAGYVATIAALGAFAAAVVAFVIMLGESPDDARAHDDVVDVALGRPVPLRLHAAHRPAERDDDADRRRRRLADRRLLGRLHGRRGRGATLLRVHLALRLLDAAARPGRQPAAAARRLGHGRPLELPADRLPPGPPVGDRGRQEGVRDERVRRRDDGALALPADPAHRPARLRRRVRHVAATAARSRT